jgi:hypothetical protein
MPTYVSYPFTIADGSVTPGQHASFLGKRHDPFFFKNDPNQTPFQLPELTLPADLDLERMRRRRALQTLVDGQTGLLERSAEVRGFDDYYQKAIEMLTSDRVRAAFDLESESESLRDRYGRTTYGQSCLLARRLVEAGVKFVTVYFSRSIGGRRVNEGGWDTHGFDNTRMYKIVNKYQLPITDQTLPTLLDDLEERGLLEDTLVVWMGEFGRTPKINKMNSRDHWPAVSFALVAGGGMRTGQVIGSTNRLGEHAHDRPVTFQEVFATLYHNVGIDPRLVTVQDLQGRPQYLVDSGVEPIRELV